MTWKPQPSSAGDLTSLCKSVVRKLARITGENPAVVIIYQTNESSRKDGTNCHWVSNHQNREDTIKQLRATADAMEATMN